VVLHNDNGSIAQRRTNHSKQTNKPPLLFDCVEPGGSQFLEREFEILKESPCLGARKRPGSSEILETQEFRSKIGSCNVRKTTELQQLCVSLEQFGLPSAIADLNEQRFIAWNAIFLEQTGFSGAEITTLTVGKTIATSDPAIILPGGVEKFAPGLLPCVVRGAMHLSVLPGYVQRSPDGLAHILLEPRQNLSGRDFQHGQLFGQEKERIRMRQVFHQDVSSPILAAIFAIATAKDAAKTASVSDSLQKASDLLTGTLEAMGAALEGKESRS
jgi:hypothetical protein